MCGRTDDLLPIMKRLPVDIYELDFPVDLVHAREVLGPDEIILGNVNTVEEMLTRHTRGGLRGGGRLPSDLRPQPRRGHRLRGRARDTAGEPARAGGLRS